MGLNIYEQCLGTQQAAIGWTNASERDNSIAPNISANNTK